VALLVGVTLAATTGAQPPGGRRPAGQAGAGEMRGRTEATVDEFVARLLSLDADKDGKLQKSEVGDARLYPLLARIDADRNGVVTPDEMRALFARESAELAKSRATRGGPSDPGAGPRRPGRGGAPPRGPGEPTAPPAGGRPGRPAPGEPQ
jgi:hypothetical protein